MTNASVYTQKWLIWSVFAVWLATAIPITLFSLFNFELPLWPNFSAESTREGIAVWAAFVAWLYITPVVLIVIGRTSRRPHEPTIAAQLQSQGSPVRDAKGYIERLAVFETDETHKRTINPQTGEELIHLSGSGGGHSGDYKFEIRRPKEFSVQFTADTAPTGIKGKMIWQVKVHKRHQRQIIAEALRAFQGHHGMFPDSVAKIQFHESENGIFRFRKSRWVDA